MFTRLSGCDTSSSINSAALYTYMVENTMLTSGTMISTRFNRLNIPFDGLSSRLKTLNEITAKNTVKAMMILLRNRSRRTYLMIFFHDDSVLISRTSTALRASLPLHAQSRGLIYFHRYLPVTGQVIYENAICLLPYK